MGALSALLALGLFQFDGGSGLVPLYDVTAPLFDKITLHLDEKYYQGKVFSIVCDNQGPQNIYIMSARWNGKEWNNSLLPHDQLIKGGCWNLNYQRRKTKIGEIIFKLFI